jgi:DNA-binding response OmpR family regulator
VPSSSQPCKSKLWERGTLPPSGYDRQVPESARALRPVRIGVDELWIRRVAVRRACEAGREMLGQRQFPVDLMLPGYDGSAVYPDVRLDSEVPRTIVSAKGHSQDIVDAQETGAKAFVTALYKFVARIRPLLRRGVLTDLTRTVLRLLCRLVASPGLVIGRKLLLGRVLEDDLGDSRLVDVSVGRPRHRIDVHPVDPQVVEAVRGLGDSLPT